jgi:hypothetical protein
LVESSATEVPAKAPKAAGPANQATSWLVPIITAIVLISAFGLYFFVYGGARRESLNQRNFRALAGLGEQLQTRIAIHSSILEFYTDQAYAGRYPSERHREKGNLGLFVVRRAEDVNLPPSLQQREAAKDYLNYLAPNFELAEEPTMPSDRPNDRLGVQRRDGRWVLVFAAEGQPGQGTAVKASLKLEDLLKPLVASLPFDDVLLAYEDGAIIYQDKKVGAQVITLSSLLENQTAPAGTKLSGDSDSSAASSPHAGAVPRIHGQHLTEIIVAGKAYKLFLQPVLIDVFSSDPQRREPPREWVLCGLRSSRALEWEALAISYTSIIWLSLLFFAICLGGPVLKVLLMNHRDRLRPQQLAFLGLFLVLLSGVLTLSGLQVGYFHLTDDTEAHLRQLGGSLSNNLHRELTLMLHQLQVLCQTPELDNDLRRAERSEVIRKDLEARPSAPLAKEYPYLDSLFWTDSGGHQVVKWSASEYVTPMIDISQLDIYTHPKTLRLSGKGPPFYFASVLPPNKLGHVAALTMRTCDCNPSLCNSHREDLAGGSAFLMAQPLSLIDPALPFGYGFALVDRTGLVLFHVDKTKNMRENFLQESDSSKELYAAIFSHAQSSLRINYSGVDYQAVVMPITGISQAPWSLIVYRDLTSLRTLDLQAMTMASTLLLLLLAGPAVVMTVWCVDRRPRLAPDWLWPNPQRKAIYQYQVWAYTLLIILFLFLGFRPSTEESVIACAAVPYTAWLLTAWCYRLYPSPVGERVESTRRWFIPVLTGFSVIVLLGEIVSRWSHLRELTFLLGVAGIAAVPLFDQPRRYLSWKWNRWFLVGETVGEDSGQTVAEELEHRAFYATGLFLLVLLLGVLTPMALFHASLRVERRLLIKQAQLQLLSTLDQHQMRIENQFAAGERGDAKDSGFYLDATAWQKMGLNPPFSSDADLLMVPHAPSLTREFYSGWFRRLIYLLHHDYNQTAAEMLGVIQDSNSANLGSDSPDWIWTDEESTISLRWHRVQPQAEDSGRESDLIIRTGVPAFSSSDALIGACVAAAVMLIMGSLFRGLARKLFPSRFAAARTAGPREVAESILDGRSVVCLVPLASTWQLPAPKWTIDLAFEASGPEWAELLDLNRVPVGTLVEIQHFEYRTNDPKVDNQKFVLLRRLTERGNTQIAVVMNVDVSPLDYRRMFPGLDVIDLREDPSSWLAVYEGPARDLLWKECGPLPGLWPIGAQLTKDIGTESVHSESAVVSEILERAEQYYRTLWRECSNEQKFVLTQLAEDGLLNAANARAARQLVRQGLIVKDPQFRIANESLRNFLTNAASPELLQGWLRESRQGDWRKAIGDALFTTMIIVGVFLLATQNQLWQSSAAYVTAAFGALGTFAKLFNTVRNSASAEKAG